MIVILDSNILGLLANPSELPEAKECQDWLYALLAKSVYVASSELCFYEVKRGLIEAKKRGGTGQGIGKLEELRDQFETLPINRMVVDEAAEIWAKSRLEGKPSAEEKALDIDIIIAAHYRVLTQEFPGRYVVISTKNIKHFKHFAEAQEWQNIKA